MEVSPLIPILVSAGLTAVAAFLSWYHADGQSKARSSFMEEKINTLERKHDRDEADMDKRVTDVETKSIQYLTERQEIRRDLERIDNSKASKEVVDNFRNEITNLRTDMDKRFDRIEKLLERFTTGRNKRQDDLS